jgi:16S rRNA (uracil1498-N3)-methyltransferase
MSKIHRFISDFDLSKKEIEIKGEIAHQIIKVLKLKLGEKIELCDGKNINAIAEIVEIKKNTVLVKLGATLRHGYTEQHNTKKVNLFCAVLKKENFELVVQKTTEVGVSKIIPIITSRTIKTGLNLERLNKIAKEASEQSGRLNVPELSEPISFLKAIEIADGENILFDASGELTFEMHCGGCRALHSKFSAENYVRISKDDSLLANIFIGPEGGWTTEEIEIAKSHNFKIATLGSLTLRGETAAIISTYLAINI